MYFPHSSYGARPVSVCSHHGGQYGEMIGRCLDADPNRPRRIARPSRRKATLREFNNPGVYIWSCWQVVVGYSRLELSGLVDMKYYGRYM